DLFHELEVSQTLIDYSDTLFSCHRLNGEFTYASPSFLKFFGYQQEELVDAPLVDFLHPQDKPTLEKLDLTQPHEKRHYRFCRKEGDYVWLEIALVPRMANDQPNGFICISRDITEIVAAKVKQEEHKEKYRRLVEKFIDTVGIITKDGHMIYMNEAGKKLFGVTRKEEIIGSSVFG
ncbi:PAS domain S-box protein, partial [Butyricicoccus sp. 1XD8-22]